jgi:hypothetical protein
MQYYGGVALANAAMHFPARTVLKICDNRLELRP